MRLHRCGKWNAYHVLTLISKSNYLNFYAQPVQEYELTAEMHKMTVVLEFELHDLLLYTARNAYDTC